MNSFISINLKVTPIINRYRCMPERIQKSGFDSGVEDAKSRNSNDIRKPRLLTSILVSVFFDAGCLSTTLFLTTGMTWQATTCRWSYHIFGLECADFFCRRVCSGVLKIKNNSEPLIPRLSCN